jgi:hypothetical protein
MKIWDGHFQLCQKVADLIWNDTNVNICIFCCGFPLKEITAYIRFTRLPRCYKGFRGVIKTAEAAHAVLLKPLNTRPRSHWNRFVRFRGTIETAKADDSKRLLYLEFLREVETICETALAHESGPKGGIVWWKNQRVENCPFKEL